MSVHKELKPVNTHFLYSKYITHHNTFTLMTAKMSSRICFSVALDFSDENQ